MSLGVSGNTSSRHEPGLLISVKHHLLHEVNLEAAPAPAGAYESVVPQFQNCDLTGAQPSVADLKSKASEDACAPVQNAMISNQGTTHPPTPAAFKAD